MKFLMKKLFKYPLWMKFSKKPFKEQKPIHASYIIGKY